MDQTHRSGGHGTRTHNRFPGTTFPVWPLAIRLPSKQRKNDVFCLRKSELAYIRPTLARKHVPLSSDQYSRPIGTQNKANPLDIGDLRLNKRRVVRPSGHGRAASRPEVGQLLFVAHGAPDRQPQSDPTPSTHSRSGHRLQTTSSLFVSRRVLGV